MKASIQPSVLSVLPVLAVVLASLLLALLPATAPAENLQFIEGSGTPGRDAAESPCPGSQLLMNHDGGTENAFCWDGGGVQPPWYGGFAEGYADMPGTICGLRLILTRWGSMTGNGVIDLYVWDYDDAAAASVPGIVLSVTTEVPITGISLWPIVTAYDVDCTDAVASPDGFFVGFWPSSFQGAPGMFGIAMDENGPGGVPRTCVAPDIGYPTGWCDPVEVGYPTRAYGVCAWLAPGTASVPETGDGGIRNSSWGAVKRLYD